MPAKPDARAIAGLIERAPDLASLEAELARRGDRLPGPRRLRRFLIRAWRRAHAERIDELRVATDPSFAGLSGTTVVRGERTFTIHGVVHGQRRALRLSALARSQLKDAVEAFIDPPRADVATERGFERTFDLPHGTDLDYSRDFFRTIGPWRMIRLVLVLLLVLPLAPLITLMMRWAPDPVARVMSAAMKDLAALDRLRAIYALRELPPRIDLALPSGSTRVRIAHSQAIARALIARASRSDVGQMHAVVGLAHEAEVAFLLSRPEGP
jgi:hypothetical protein